MSQMQVRCHVVNPMMSHNPIYIHLRLFYHFPGYENSVVCLSRDRWSRWARSEVMPRHFGVPWYQSFTNSNGFGFGAMAIHIPYQMTFLDQNFIFPFSWECHHPNWRTHIFQRGGEKPPTSIKWSKELLQVSPTENHLKPLKPRRVW